MKTEKKLESKKSAEHRTADGVRLITCSSSSTVAEGSASDSNVAEQKHSGIKIP
jgi:hypothetical protein